MRRTRHTGWLRDALAAPLLMIALILSATACDSSPESTAERAEAGAPSEAASLDRAEASSLDRAEPAAPGANATGDGRRASDGDALAAALAELVETIEAVEQSIRTSPSFGDEAEQVGGYRHMLRALAKGMEAEILQDPDYPYFRILDFWLREGGDNPDQQYAFSPIRGGESYRIWGRLGSATRVELQLYAGKPWAGTGRSAGYLTFEDLAVDADGAFEVLLSSSEPADATATRAAGRPAASWLLNPPDANTVFVRHIYDEWSDAATGEVHIDRVGFEGRRRPAETKAELAARIRAAAEMFGTTARTWPAFLVRRYLEAGQPNTVPPPYDTYALGGAKGRWMSGGSFTLEPGQALLIRVPPSAAQVQGIQLTDMWFASLEHANLISSLTTKQAVRSADGDYYFVIAGEDPGHANWLDTGGLRRGTFLMRWDGISGELPTAQHPQAERVDLDELAGRIPGFERVDPETRDATRAARRRHLQRRAHR